MSYPTLLLGETGTGKSAALRNFTAKDVLLIQALAKPLPFQSNDWKVYDKETKTGNIFVTDLANEIVNLVQGTRRKIIVIDDFQYVMGNEFMRRSNEKGYDKFTEIGRNAWNILVAVGGLQPDVRVYILSHTDTSDSGRVKIKTIGRMLDEKITVEGMFTQVIRTAVRDGEYFFSTKNNGNDTVKTPMGMFEEELIPNDLAAFDQRVCQYYQLK